MQSCARRCACTWILTPKINERLSSFTKTTENNFQFSEEFNSSIFDYKVYESTEYNNILQKNSKTKISFLFNEDSDELLGIKIETQDRNNKAFISSQNCLKNINLFSFSEEDRNCYDEAIEETGATIGNYVVKKERTLFILLNKNYIDYIDLI